METTEELRNRIFDGLKSRLYGKKPRFKKAADCLRGSSPFFDEIWYIQYTYILPDTKIRAQLAAHYGCNDLDALAKKILLDFLNRAR